LFRSRSIVAVPIEFNSHASLATADALVAAGYSPGNAPGVAALLRRFALDLEVGEFVISPVSGQQRHLIGMVASDYRFVLNEDNPGLQHLRDVSWYAEVPASEFPIQLRPTLGSPMVFYLPAAQHHLRSFLREQGLLNRATGA
jgi:predicted Mrr-cat superfamily restriction endonuclease